jgi:hypothetical protein
MVIRPYPTPRRTWLLAVLLTLLLHAGALLLAQRIGLRVAPAQAAEPEPIQVVFRPEPDEPHTYTEQPAENANEAPEHPEFLSNVDSRARDRSGGKGNTPQLEGPIDVVPQVPIAAGTPQPPASGAAQGGATAPDADTELARNLVLRPKTRPPDVRPAPDGSSTAPPSETPPAESHPSMAELSQEEMSRPDAGALLSGDIRLSTTAWEYAPWLEAFRRAVIEHWYPPAAYGMGMIHGWCVIELEVERDGTMRNLHVLDDDVGHKSLTSAAVLALEGAAPFRSLPAGFPDDSLVMQVRFTYPRLRH